MIKVCDQIVDDKYFPDNTFSFRLNFPDELEQYDWFPKNIVWNYEKEEEMIKLYYIVKHIRSLEPDAYIALYLPYIPNARMDRIKNRDEVFTLKYFAEFINSLEFKKVYVRDPHSNVACALINNIVIDNCSDFIDRAFCDITTKNNNLSDVILYYPDEGAMKRYSEILKNVIDAPYTFGIKKRDWRTGEILGIKVMDKEMVKDKNILIVDDICSKGGTFYYSSKALKDVGAKNIYLYCTHCEETIYKGELLKCDFIKHIYTTDSLIITPNDKITVLMEEI